LDPKDSPDATWAVPPGVTFARRFWDGEAVVYNEASGETHILDAFSDWLLLELVKGPAPLAALVARAAAEAGAEPARAEARVRETLARFDGEGLAEPAMPARA
jgi:PqqD family protein of HPr-rel-A system